MNSNNPFLAGLLSALLSGGSTLALAQANAGGNLVPNAGPLVTTIGVNDVFKDVVNGFPQAQDYYVSAATLAGFVGNGGAGTNFLIGGKADQNLWQRNTTGSSVTTTLTYGGPDRWAYWSGTSTAMTVSKVSTAAALPTGSANVFRMQRTASQTGVVQMCMAQEITSKNSYYLQGHTVLLDFNVYTGANFSGTGMTAYVSYGTGTDEGLAGTSSYAYGLNAGGGGSGSWTGQANATAAVIPLGAVSTAYRVAAVASIPTTATEVAVALCYTPTGTASTTDALYFDNIELRKADVLAGFVNTTAGYVLSNNVLTATINGVVTNATIPAFSLRPYEEEQRNQLAYFWQITEPAASKAVGNGNYQTNTICDVQIPLPVPMRVAPTLTIGGTAESNTTWAVMIASTTPVALASTYLIQDAVIGNTTNMIAVQATTAAKTAGQGCTLVGAGGGANIQASAEL